MAYDLPEEQISGPAWLSVDKFDVVAKVPAGATKEQARRMLRALLESRFALAAHGDTKQMPAYALTVAKSGSKLRTPQPDTGEATIKDPGRSPYQVVLDDAGNARLPPGRPGMALLMLKDGRFRVSARMKSPADLLSLLRSQVGRPVEDMTGLTGPYDFDFDFTSTHRPPAAAPAGAVPEADDQPGVPDLIAALEKHLGLKLEARKIPVQILVVDHAERTPAEN